MKHYLSILLAIIITATFSFQVAASSFLENVDIKTYQTTASSPDLIAYVSVALTNNYDGSVTAEATLRANQTSDKLDIKIYLQRLNDGQWYNYELITEYVEYNQIFCYISSSSSTLPTGTYRGYAIFTCIDNPQSETVTNYTNIVDIQ